MRRLGAGTHRRSHQWVQGREDAKRVLVGGAGTHCCMCERMATM